MSCKWSVQQEHKWVVNINRGNDTHISYGRTTQIQEWCNQSLNYMWKTWTHSSFPILKSDTVWLISHMVYCIQSYTHRGYVLQSEAIGNNGSEEGDVTTDCPFCNNVSFNRPVSSWRWDNHSTVPVPPDRLWPPTAGSVHSQGHMGGMWPSRAHVDHLNEGIMRHGGRTIHA